MNMDASSTETASSTPENSVGLDFLHVHQSGQRLRALRQEKSTPVPPEPNGYPAHRPRQVHLHQLRVGARVRRLCNLRFDDTNPVKEDTEYVDSIREDVTGSAANGTIGNIALPTTSINCMRSPSSSSVTARRMWTARAPRKSRASRGTLTQPGTESPYRNRSIEENLDLFHRMRGGEFADGEHVLRAKIDMASPTWSCVTPTLYRIRHAEHHWTGDKWCVYPCTTFYHCLSDSLEGITHSICTLEFVNNRELY